MTTEALAPKVKSLFFEQYKSKLPIREKAFLKSTLQGVCERYKENAVSGYLDDVIDTACFGSYAASQGFCKEPFKSKNKEVIMYASEYMAESMATVIDILSKKYEELSCAK